MPHQPIENIYNLMGINVGGDMGALTFYKNKRGKLVFFDKAPPLQPPSTAQKWQRMKFRFVAKIWNKLSKEEKQQYELASRRASYCCNGFNLFSHFVLMGRAKAKATLARQTGTNLV